MKVTIYGTSDDLVEVEGDLKEEFSGDDLTLVFGDGTHIRAKYADDGCWRLSRVATGSAKFEHVFTATDSDSEEYSDKVTLEGDLRVVDKIWTRGEIVDALVDADWNRLPEQVLSEVFVIAKKHGACR